jgi:hypothetical protein
MTHELIQTLDKWLICSKFYLNLELKSQTKKVNYNKYLALKFKIIPYWSWLLEFRFRLIYNVLIVIPK